MNLFILIRTLPLSSVEEGRVERGWGGECGRGVHDSCIKNAVRTKGYRVDTKFISTTD